MADELQVENIEKLYAEITPKRWAVAESPDGNDVWSKLRTVNAIDNFIDDFQSGKKRIFVVHAGRRSFKSELSKRLLVWYALNHADQNLIYAGPTIGQTSKIAWEDLKKLVPPYAVKKTLEMDLELRLINGTKIRIAGLDVPERVEGVRLNGIVIDEMGDVKDEVFRVNILPALADTYGWCIMCGTPNGCVGEFYEVYSSMVSKSEQLPDYGLYHWSTADVRGQSFIEPFKSQMTQIQFEQEWLGLFVQGSGRAYLFEKLKHMSEGIGFNPKLPIDIAADFNVGIMPWPVCQTTNDMTYVIDEVVGRNCTIEHMCNSVKQTVTNLFHGDSYLAKGHPLRWYGDATSLSVRDPSARMSSWSQIKQHFQDWNVEFKVSKTNPRIGDRLALVNARLITADESIHTMIHPRVKELVLDLQSISYDDIISGNKTRHGSERSHASDAFGYYIYRMYYTDLRKNSGIKNFPI